MKSFTVNHSRMRKLNCVAVLRQLHLGGSMSRIELAQRLQLDSKTLTNLVRDLISCGFVSETEVIPVGGRGRPRQMLRLNGENVNALGMQITEEAVQSAIVNLNGEIREQKTVSLANLKSSEELIKRVKKAAEIPKKTGRSKILGVGIAYPGMFDAESGKIIRCLNLPPLEGVRLADVAADICPNGVFSLEGDTQAQAIAEYWFGAARNLEDYIFIGLGTGIGCAMVRNGNAERGFRQIAGELGHMIVREKGALCSCGRRGCLETIASLDQIRRGKNDREKAALLQDAANAVGLALANLICIMNPAHIILGGESLELGPAFAASVKKAVEKHVMKEFQGTFSIKESRLGTQGSLLGGSIGVLKSIFAD